MYLKKKTYIFENENKKIKVVGCDVKNERISEITERVGYWRKFNALHNWFVKNCQDGVDDCRECYISKNDQELLIKTLEEISEANKKSRTKGITKAQKLLPTQDGFFFGGTEYDDWYFQYIEETLSIFLELREEQKNKKDDGNLVSLYYKSSW